MAPPDTKPSRQKERASIWSFLPRCQALNCVLRIQSRASNLMSASKSPGGLLEDRLLDPLPEILFLGSGQNLGTWLPNKFPQIQMLLVATLL